jgi:hypothetical protein
MNTLHLLFRGILSLLPAAIMGAALGAVTINQNTLLPAGDLSLDGQEVVVDGVTLTVAGAHTFASLQLRNGAVLTHEPATGGQAERAIRLMVTGNVTVDAASRIDTTGKGYAEATSPGAGAKGNTPAAAAATAAVATGATAFRVRAAGLSARSLRPIPGAAPAATATAPWPSCRAAGWCISRSAARSPLPVQSGPMAPVPGSTTRAAAPEARFI